MWQVLHLRSYFKKSALFSFLLPTSLSLSFLCFWALSLSHGARSAWRAHTAVATESARARETDHICPARQNTLSTDESERGKGGSVHPSPFCSSPSVRLLHMRGMAVLLFFFLQTTLAFLEAKWDRLTLDVIFATRKIDPPTLPCSTYSIHSIRSEQVSSRRRAAVALHTLDPRLETVRALILRDRPF